MPGGRDGRAVDAGRVVRIAPNRAAAPRNSRFGQNERLSDSAIRRFGDSVIPRIRGCQPDRAGPGRAQRRSYAAQATQATHLGATSRSNKFLSGLICIVKEFPRKFESMRYLVTCSCCSTASRLLRLCLSACGARQAAPMHAYRRICHLRVCCIDAAVVVVPRCHLAYST